MIIQLGYPLDDPVTMKGFNPYLKNAVYATVASYPHLTDLTIRAFATAYVALFLPIDDYFADKPGPISEFNSRLIQGIEQEHPLLEAYAHLLRELPKYWDPVMADMMRQSAMTFLTSLVVERQLENAKVCFRSSQYSGILRSISATERIGPRPVYTVHDGYIIDTYHVRIPFWSTPTDIFGCESGVRSLNTVALITKYRHCPQ